MAVFVGTCYRCGERHNMMFLMNVSVAHAVIDESVNDISMNADKITTGFILTLLCLMYLIIDLFSIHN